jgi:hypothetical protein
MFRIAEIGTAGTARSEQISSFDQVRKGSWRPSAREWLEQGGAIVQSRQVAMNAVLMLDNMCLALFPTHRYAVVELLADLK